MKMLCHNCFLKSTLVNDFLTIFKISVKHVKLTLVSFQSVLESLPGVDPQSDAVRQAVGAMSGQQKDSKKKDDDKKDSDKK